MGSYCCLENRRPSHRVGAVELSFKNQSLSLRIGFAPGPAQAQPSAAGTGNSQPAVNAGGAGAVAIPGFWDPRRRPERPDLSRVTLIRFVSDRPGHDFRYAIDPTKIRDDLGWRPVEPFDAALEKTVRWYLGNRAWWSNVRAGVYRGERLGVLT